ncbi:MAG: DUF4339 domain-containing protein [Gemmataceae bacterium]|nr:DUF4339 domain-containing protein [Gemmataceae bacterium]MCI0741405.1 DUF4339 domain-containing protein [Gemmataceae bacterium]
MPKEWFYTSEGRQMEPVSDAELKQLAAKGMLKPTDMVWTEGMPKWVRASTAKELFPQEGITVSYPSTAAPKLAASSPAPKLATTSKGIGETVPLAPLGHSGAAKKSNVKDVFEDVEDKELGRESCRKPSRDADDYEDDDRPRRRRSREASGLSSGAKVGIILGGAATLIAVVVIIIVVISNSGRGGGNVNPGAGGGGVAAKPGAGNILASYTVENIQPDGSDRRTFQFQANTRYRFESKAKNRGGDLDLYLMDEQNMDLMSDDSELPDSHFEWVAPYTGRFKVEVYNFPEPPVPNSATVTITELGPGNPQQNPVMPPPQKKGKMKGIGGNPQPPIQQPPIQPKFKMPNFAKPVVPGSVKTHPPVTSGPHEVGPNGLQITGELLQTDARVFWKPLHHPCKVYTVNLKANTTYVFRMDGIDNEQLGFDPHLYLETSNNVLLAQNDDFNRLNSLITHRTTAAGTYRVVAGSHNGIMGGYMLRVEEQPLQK